MPFKLYIAFLFSSIIIYSQTNLADIIYPLSHDTLNLSSFPVYSRDELIVMQDNIELLKKPQYPNGCDFNKLFFLDTSHVNHFTKIDINGDGQLDILYSGSFCSDEPIDIIWIKQNNLYKELKSYYGTIFRIIKNKNSGCSFLIRTGYCCGGRVGTYKLYSPCDTNRNRFIENQFNKMSEYIGTQFPAKRTLDKPFKTIHDRTRLRSSHEEINTLDTLQSAFYDAAYGNIIAEYVERSTGRLLSEYEEPNGDHWYFVLMDWNNYIGYNRFYNAYETNKCGWINSKDIKIL